MVDDCLCFEGSLHPMCGLQRVIMDTNLVTKLLF